MALPPCCDGQMYQLGADDHQRPSRWCCQYGETYQIQHEHVLARRSCVFVAGSVIDPF